VRPLFGFRDSAPSFQRIAVITPESERLAVENIANPPGELIPFPEWYQCQPLDRVQTINVERVKFFEQTIEAILCLPGCLCFIFLSDERRPVRLTEAFCNPLCHQIMLLCCQPAIPQGTHDRNDIRNNGASLFVTPDANRPLPPFGSLAITLHLDVLPLVLLPLFRKPRTATTLQRRGILDYYDYRGAEAARHRRWYCKNRQDLKTMNTSSNASYRQRRQKTEIEQIALNCRKWPFAYLEHPRSIACRSLPKQA